VDPRHVASAIACALTLGSAAALAALPVAASELEARSSDGRWILRADNATRELIAIDAGSGAAVKRIAVADKRGTPSRVARVLDAPPRASFIALLADVPEAWELPYGANAEPVFDGLVHDYRMGEGLAAGGPLPVRRIVLDVPLTDALFSPRFEHFVAAAGGGKLHVVNLDVRRRIETIEAGGAPRPDLGTAWNRRRLAFLIPDAVQARLLVLDARVWRLAAVVPLPAVARAVRIDADRIDVITTAGLVRLTAAELRVD
jgi:hypothetical protein